jgi:GAF domain-containing protein
MPQEVATDLEGRLATALRELFEAREQQTATSEVLRVISSSPGNLEPVFQTMLTNAVRICKANFGNIYLRDGEVFRLAAAHNTPPALAEERKRTPLRDARSSNFGRMVQTKQVVHVDDLSADRSYLDRDLEAVSAVELGHIRTILFVPMLKDAELVGAIIIYRQDVRPFAERQIELVRGFASQAVIAIENTRLLNELRESLQQQTATSEVLQVISSSPGELQPVFEIMLANATRLCGAKFGTLYLCEGDGFRATAMYNAPPAFSEARASVIHPPSDSTLGRAAHAKQPSQIIDITASRAYVEGDPFVVGAVARGGYRAVLSVPLLKDDTVRRFRRSAKSRLRWSRILPARRSSLSRIRGFLTSCARRCSSRPPPPTCLRSSAARPSICKPCLAHWSSRQHGCATPIVLKSCVRETRGFILQRVTVTRQSSLNTSRTLLFRRDERALPGGSCSRERFFKSRMS